MEAAYEFALNGPNMDFALYRIREGHPIPPGLFIDIMTEKCQLINKHLHDSHNHLMLMASITNTSVSIQFHDILFEDSEFRWVTLSNCSELEDQLIYLWTEVCDILRYYHINDHEVELAAIDTFYSDLAYNEMVQANFMDF